MLLAIAYLLIEKGKNVVLLDPHGNLVEEALQFDHWKQHPEKLVYLHPTLDAKFQLGLNPFEASCKTRQDAERKSARWCYAFLRLLGDQKLSMVMQTLLKPVLSLLFYAPWADFETLKDFFIRESTDTRFQKWVQYAPRHTQAFLNGAFQDSRYKVTKMAIYTRLQHFMNYGVLQSLFNGSQTLDLTTALWKGKSVLINLSKTALGHEVSDILWKLMIANLLGIFFWSKIPKETYLIVDEAHLIADESLQSILTEARKRGLFFIWASQSISQFEASLRQRLQTNIGVFLLGRHYDQNNNAFLRAISIDKSKLLSLKPYRFLVKTEESSVIELPSPKRLLGKCHRMIPSKKHYKALVEKQLKQFYKRLDDNNTPKVSENLNEGKTLRPKF